MRIFLNLYLPLFFSTISTKIIRTISLVCSVRQTGKCLVTHPKTAGSLTCSRSVEWSYSARLNFDSATRIDYAFILSLLYL